jgi:phage-related protein
MEKRKLLLNDYNTATDGLWTLSSCRLTKGEQVQAFLVVPGRYTPLDLTDYTTEGQPYYGNASLEVVLESSEGDRAARQNRVDELVDTFDGKSITIVHPDHPNHYLIGRVQIRPQYNDMAHAAVQLSAVCEPWLYKTNETTQTLTASSTEKNATLTNSGRLAVVPNVTVTGSGTFTLTYGQHTWNLTAGEHILPDLYLTPGTHRVTYKGSGTMKITYREAVLAA